MPKKSGGGSRVGGGKINSIRWRGSGGSVSKVSPNASRLASSVVARVKHARAGAKSAKRGEGRFVITDSSYSAAAKALDANKAYQARRRGGSPYQYQASTVSKSGKMTEHHFSRKEKGGKEVFLGVGPKGQTTYKSSR